MPMYDPPHPGQLARYDCLEPPGLTTERAAQGLGVSPDELLDLMDGKASVSVDMSIRLSKAFGSSPEVWLGMQVAYDQWQIGSGAKRVEVERFWSDDHIPEQDMEPAVHPPIQSPLPTESSMPATVAASPSQR